MPSCMEQERDWSELQRKRAEYRKKLIAKGVVDGSNKMRELMFRKGL